jgi:hypothetical protein
MNIKINNKEYNIKPASELTVKEYVEFMTRVEGETGGFSYLIQYLSVITGLWACDVAQISISKQDIRRITAFIGNVEEMPEAKEFYYKRSGKTLHRNSLNWQTLGARKMIEESGLDNNLKQTVYLLAVYLSDYDASRADKIHKELQDYNAFDVFGFALFFFRNL